MPRFNALLMVIEGSLFVPFLQLYRFFRRKAVII